jgi:hypothetical protein
MNSAAFTFFAGPALSDSVLLDMTWPTKAQRSNQYHFNQILKISAKYLDRPVALSAGTGLNGNCVFQVHGKEDNQTKRRTPAFSPQAQTASRIPADPRSLVGDSGPSKHTRRDCLKNYSSIAGLHRLSWHVASGSLINKERPCLIEEDCRFLHWLLAR